LPGGPFPLRGSQEERLFDRLLQALAHDYVPLAVVVNEQMEALHILGDPDGYFRLQSGKILNDITKIAVQGSGHPAGHRLAAGVQDRRRAEIHRHPGEVARRIPNRASPHPPVARQEGPGTPGGGLRRAEPPHVRRRAASGDAQVYDVGQEAEQRIQDLEQELQFSRENLQATIEELETSNEELQATNEELLASNEELQSTNEELQSVNEELQSVNEELHTVNAEHQSKIIELIELNNDLDNLITSTRIATLFLDENMVIRRFTPEIKRIFKILDSDVGRPVSHFFHTLASDPFELIAKSPPTPRSRNGRSAPRMAPGS
jgi:two-component system CheB/CheR fusion protein